MAGICMFYAPDGSTNLTGAALALFSGIAYASYVVLLPRFQMHYISSLKFSLYLCLICSAIMPVVLLSTNSFTVPANPLCWLVCLVFSLTLCLGAITLFRQGTLIIGGQNAAILSTFEPITSIFIGITLFQEAFGWRTALGSILVILATILIALSDTKKAKS